jgi:hypothetical protein
MAFPATLPVAGELMASKPGPLRAPPSEGSPLPSLVEGDHSGPGGGAPGLVRTAG